MECRVKLCNECSQKWKKDNKKTTMETSFFILALVPMLVCLFFGRQMEAGISLITLLYLAGLEYVSERKHII